MNARDHLIQGFLARTHWADAQISPLAGDASNRRYLRLKLPKSGQNAVLMDAPPERGEDVRPFVRIAQYLTDQGLSAPQIFAADEAAGFLILEDLGDDLFARVLADDPGQAAALYGCAVDLLADLHRRPAPELATYSPKVMADMAALAFDWYAPAAGGDTCARAEFHAAMLAALTKHAADCDVLIQRDYHAENLLWLPDRNGLARVGLLDFQDAMRGHRAYDLVSLLQDARRDVAPETEAAMLARYIAQTGADDAGFRAAYHCLGAQRNLRIVGVFARLCLRDGKAHYPQLIPRVWGLLQRDLAAEPLREVAKITQAALPAPTPEIISKIVEKCATHPDQ